MSLISFPTLFYFLLSVAYRFYFLHFVSDIVLFPPSYRLSVHVCWPWPLLLVFHTFPVPYDVRGKSLPVSVTVLCEVPSLCFLFFTHLPTNNICYWSFQKVERSCGNTRNILPEKQLIKGTGMFLRMNSALHICVRACVRACVCVCVYVCVCEWVCGVYSFIYERERERERD